MRDQELYQQSVATKPKRKKAPKPAPVQQREVVVQVGTTDPMNMQPQGLGPVSAWEQQKDQFIPFNMRNYQERLLQLLKRIQEFGVESFVYQKKPYLYTGSWMEYVRNLDDLMLQINGVNPNEACMKIFNVLFPYPKPLPLGLGDESSLTGFFDGMTNIDKSKESKDCQPEQLLENINSKTKDAEDDALKKNELQDV